MTIGTIGSVSAESQRYQPLSSEEQKPLQESATKSKINIPNLTEAVQKAMGNLAKDAQECDKEFGLPIETVVPFLTETITDFFQNKDELIIFGRFTQDGVRKKWKFFVELNRNREVTDIVVGCLQSSGRYTSAYYTYNEKVILVARKKEERSVAQMEKAFTNTCYLHNAFSRLEESSKEIQELIECLEFSGSFNEIKEKLIQYLPPKPKIIFIGNRALSIVPVAKPAENIFSSPPKTKKEVEERIKVLLNVATCIAVCHTPPIGFIHSDLKPENILVCNGVGRMNDIGGSFIFSQNLTVEEMIEARKAMVTSSDYSHYQDRQVFSQIISEPGEDCVEKLLAVLRARDVFSLGVSTIEVLNGLNLADGQMNEPFLPHAYKKINEEIIIDGSDYSRKPVTCIKDLTGNVAADTKLQSLLDRSTKWNYSKRGTAMEFAKDLNAVYKELTATVNSD